MFTIPVPVIERNLFIHHGKNQISILDMFGKNWLPPSPLTCRQAEKHPHSLFDYQPLHEYIPGTRSGTGQRTRVKAQISPKAAQGQDNTPG